MASVTPETDKAMPVATAIAMPMATATAVPMNPVPVAPPSNFTKGVGYTPMVPAGAWKSGPMECGASGGCICCAAFCCQWITMAQLYEKVLGKAGSCMKWALIMFVFYAMRQISDPMIRITPATNAYGQINMMFIVWSNVAWIGTLGLTIVGTIVLMAVRKRVREKDNIPVYQCGTSEDCCCSFWCPCCTTIQLFTQLEIRQESGYQLCHPEGQPTEGGAPPQV